jgi:hypothetical protein
VENSIFASNVSSVIWPAFLPIEVQIMLLKNSEIYNSATFKIHKIVSFNHLLMRRFYEHYLAITLAVVPSIRNHCPLSTLFTRKGQGHRTINKHQYQYVICKQILLSIWLHCSVDFHKHNTNSC